MALDPRISLAAQGPDISNLFTNFRDSMERTKAIDRNDAAAPFEQQLLEQRAALGKQQATDDRSQRRLSNLYQTGQQLKPFLDRGDTQGAQNFMLNNISRLQGRVKAGEDIDITESMETLQKLQQGDVQGVMGDIAAVNGLFNQQSGRGQTALKSNAPITDPVTGQVSTPVFNKQTGETTLVPIEGAIQETQAQISDREFRSEQRSADLDVDTTRRKEAVKKTAKRTSDLKKEFSDRRRLAARSTRKIKEAQKLSEKASQGLVGASKVQLGRVFPGIDVGSETALTGALKSLALDELQKFTGPTTDFEFRVTEDIAGSLGDGASANKARLASLERANWFISRESQQFNDHIKAGHDPDAFFFNFNETGLTKRINDPITGKEKVLSYSLQDLQDTAVFNNISIDEVMKRLK